MQTKLLFNIEGVDLSRIAVPREEVARYNPHRGLMALLDGVIWHSEDFRKAVGVKRVRHDEFWVQEHFPQRPIMPGVLLVEAGAQLANFIFRKRRGPCLAGFTRIRDVVFREQVRPGDTLYLLAEEVKYTPRRFVTNLQGLVRDKIAFEGRVTGMVLQELPEADAAHSPAADGPVSAAAARG